MTELFRLENATTPLLVSIPHAGTVLPDEMLLHLNERGMALADTDWFVDRLYDWVPETGAGLLVARYSRYVVDLNRPPDDAALYASPVPGLVPAETFDGEPIYMDRPPDEAAKRDRVNRYWIPWHARLQSELQRIKAKFGYVILLDAHSIRSRVPNLFKGKLPDLNLGTNNKSSADAGLVESAERVLSGQSGFTTVVDGRFKGGYITRHYGKPGDRVHALQLEMSQAVYMQESPPRYDTKLAQRVQGVLRDLLSALAEWKPPA